jgi:hypothetical protein
MECEASNAREFGSRREEDEEGGSCFISRFLLHPMVRNVANNFNDRE